MKSAEKFLGTDRFMVEDKIGEGSFGVVYRAKDRKYGNTVALKVLRHRSGDTLRRFKEEFYILSGVQDANLVRLGELHQWKGRTFFSMELIEGVGFDAWLGMPKQREAGDSTWRPTQKAARIHPFQAARDSALIAIKPDRIRLGFNQIASGLATLHALGIVHRDLKPSNMIVADGNRLVILDFGLATGLTANEFCRQDGLYGTHSFMAPEQAYHGLSVTVQSDIYSVGVMLFVALTGRFPLADSQSMDPRFFNADAPADLSSLTQAMLDLDPKKRPSASALFAQLGGAANDRPCPPNDRGSTVCRSEIELDALWQAYGENRSGRAIAVCVEGSSGIGKTRLMHRFLEKLRSREDVAIFEGRCYVDVHLPYKAFDQIVCQLWHRAAPLFSKGLSGWPPDGFLELSQLFPSLESECRVHKLHDANQPLSDLHALRRRAFMALRQRVANIAEHQSVVLFIDDLQWADVDSIHVWDALQQSEVKRLFLVGTYRSSEVSTSPFLCRLFDQKKSRDIRKIVLSGLLTEDASQLAAFFSMKDPLQANAVVAESSGNPFIIRTIAQAMRQSEVEGGRVPARRGLRGVTLQVALATRLSGLTESAQELLRVVAIAGHPVDRKIAVSVAKIGGGEDAIALLRFEQLIRLRAVDNHDMVLEPYHDRIREAIVDGTDANTQQFIHRRLAERMEREEIADPLALAVHFRRGSDRNNAILYAVKAGEQSTYTLAFEQAAKAYQLAIEIFSEGPQCSVDYMLELNECLAKSWADAGRSQHAARGYLAASKMATGEDRTRLRWLSRRTVDSWRAL